MSPILTSVLLGLTAAGANVFGGAIIVQRNWERSYLRYFVALGAGFMLATALVEMVPASIQLRGPYAGFLILLGYLLVHFFEHTVTPHFHFGEETHADQFVHAHKSYSVLIGLLIHTFFDGIAIASGFLVSPALGWIIFVAVFLHKIPEGFTISSVMLASGRSRAFAWGASMALGVATVAGVMTMAVFRHEVSFGLPLSAGEDGATGLCRNGVHVFAGSVFPPALIQACDSSRSHGARRNSSMGFATQQTQAVGHRNRNTGRVTISLGALQRHLALARHFFQKLTIFRESLFGAECLMACAGEVRQRVRAAPDFVLLGSMKSPFRFREMIEDQHFGSERQCVSQGLPGIVHLVQTKLEVHDIPSWRSLTEVRMDNFHSIL
jgi:ZIP family zinc transporter/zinc and cadmium transporter